MTRSTPALSRPCAAIGAVLLLAACGAPGPAPAGPATAPVPATAPAPPTPAWRALFDGRSIDGWEHIGPGRFILEDGALKSEGGMGLLWYTREKFGNCVIRIVFKTTHDNSNAGVFFRIAEKPSDPWYAVHHGYESQILEREDDYHRTGAIYSLSPARGRSARPHGEWNTMEIALDGPLVRVTLNGEAVNEFDPSKPAPERKKNFEPERGPRPESGYLGIQNHDDYSQGKANVYFKEVSVRPLR